MSVKKAVTVVSLNLGIILLMLVIIEGLSGLMLLCKSLVQSKGITVAERFHTKYDPELGWSNVPNKKLPDFYGSGKDMKINGQGFRSDYDYSMKVPDKKVRIICSGDSFTLGYGVSSQMTWANLLTGYNNAVETVNMGQGGYGIDQIYLWYMRDGIKLDHDVHLFAFIGNDFRRMLRDNLVGYGKPYLKVANGDLVTCNTPVPRASYVFGWLTRNREKISKLATARLIAEFMKKEQGNEIQVNNKEVLVETIFANLHRVNSEKGRPFVLVWLPNYNNAEFDDLRSGIHQLSRKNGWHFIDLTADMEKLGEDRHKMFIPDDGTQPEYTGAAGHYSDEGNRMIARALYEKLESIPEIAGKLHKYK